MFGQAWSGRAPVRPPAVAEETGVWLCACPGSHRPSQPAGDPGSCAGPCGKVALVVCAFS